jgi:hypothetical protein
MVGVRSASRPVVPATVEQTWESILSRWRKQDLRTIAVPVAHRTAGTRSAGPVIK